MYLTILCVNGSKIRIFFFSQAALNIFPSGLYSKLKTPPTNRKHGYCALIPRMLSLLNAISSHKLKKILTFTMGRYILV